MLCRTPNCSRFFYMAYPINRLKQSPDCDVLPTLLHPPEKVNTTTAQISVLWQLVNKFYTHTQGIMDQQKKLDKPEILGLVFSLWCGKFFTVVENKATALPQDNSNSHWCMEGLLKQALFLLGLVCTRKFCKLNYAS